MLPGPFFRLAFVFSTEAVVRKCSVKKVFTPLGNCFCQYQLINLVLLSFDFFHLAKGLLIAFPWLYTIVCAVAQKYHEIYFIFIIIHIFSTHIAINLFYLHNLKMKTLEQQLHRACERTKSKQKQKQARH